MSFTLPLLDLDRRLSSDALFGANIYAVGGRVRDHVTNRCHGTVYASKDFDYVVAGMTLADVERRLAGIAQVNLVGASFAAIKVTIDGQQIDVALPRRETSTGAGHRDFAVDFGPDVSIGEDALRRDFTMVTSMDASDTAAERRRFFGAAGAVRSAAAQRLARTAPHPCWV